MSEIIKTRARESVGKEALIFLKNNFRFKGKITNADEEVIELLDYKTEAYKIITYETIKEIEVKV